MVDTWDRTVDEVKGAWDAVIDDPVGTGKQLLEDAIGVNDAKAFWNGIDPETGEEISIVDRLIRGVAAFPATKVVKLGDKGLGIAQKIFVRKHDCSCPKKNDKDDDKREETERRNQRKEELDRILDLSHSPRSESRNRRANAHLLEQDLERADFKVEDIGLIWERINHNKAKNMKEVIGEYLAEKEIRQKHGDKYESRPTKINNTVSGIDHVLVSRNADGTIDELIIAETKFNTSQKGDTNDGKQMSEEWIRAKARDMISKGKDAETRDTGRMIQAALDKKSYNGQQLSPDLIDTRYYNVKPRDKNNPQGKWVGTWERDTSSGLRNDQIPDDWP